MTNSFNKIMFISSIFCLSLIFSHPAFSQNDNSKFKSKTYATGSSGLYRDLDKDLVNRYGNMFRIRGGFLHQFAPLLTLRSGLTIAFDNASFKDKESGLKGESGITYFMLDAGIYYAEQKNSPQEASPFLGGGLVFSNIRESAELNDYAGKESVSGNSFGIKLAGGIEWEDCYIQLSINPSSGDFKTNLFSFEFVWKTDISNIAK